MTCAISRAMCVVGAVSVAGLSAQQADAGLVINLMNGASSVTVADNGVGDIDPTVGSVSFIGGVGDFDVNVTTGISKPLVGSASSPVLTLNSVNVSSTTAGGTLLVEVTDTDFIAPAGGLPASLIFGGTTNGGASIVAFADPAANAEFGASDVIVGLGPFVDGPFDAAAAGSVVATGSPYSLTLGATIVHDDAGDATSFGAQLVVPEPGSIALLGLGGLALARRRRG